MQDETKCMNEKLKDERRLKQIQDKDLSSARDRIAELCFQIGNDVDIELKKCEH